MHTCDFRTPEFEVILGYIEIPFPSLPNSHIQGKVEDKDLKNSQPSCAGYQVLCSRNIIKVIFIDGSKSHVLTSVQWMKL
jgi:hypothetical protein